MGSDRKTVASTGNSLPSSADLFADIRNLIEETRTSVAEVVNAGLTTLYWRIGRRIGVEILKGDRAAYGAEIVSSLGRQLSLHYGKGFSAKSIRHMIRFAESFPDEIIVSALRRQLSWTHFKSIIYVEEPLKRDFYAEMCRIERWSTRTLQKKIGSMLYERTALSRKPEELARIELEALRDADRMSPDLVFRGAGRKREQIELLELGESGIHVAEYLTALPPREVFQKKLKAAIELSQRRLENREANV